MSVRKTINIENYRELFHSSPFGVFTSTLKGRYVEVNDTYAHLLGYDSAENLLELLDISQEVYSVKGEREKLLKRLRAENNMLTHETKFIKKDRSLVPVRINLSLIQGERNTIFVVGLVEDISTQFNSQQAIIHEKQTLVTLIENLPDYIYYKDIEGTILIANKPVRKLLENRPQKAIPESDINLSEELFKKDEEILNKGLKVPEKLLEIADKEDQKKYLSLAKYPIMSKGKVSGLICIGRNITELRDAEQKIIESEANLHSLIESSNDFIWSVDNSLRLITFNSSFARFIKTHYNIYLEVDMPISDVFPAELKDFWSKAYSKTLKGEQLFEEIAIAARGINLYFECSINPIFNKKLSVSGISVILADISERKLAEHAIRESEERFRQLAENTSDAFILWDTDGVLYANPAFEKIFNISIEDAMNNISLIEQSIDEEDRQRFIRNRKKEANGKPKTRNQQYKLLSGRRSSKLIWSRHYPVYNVKGKIYRYVTVASDLTEQKQLEEAITKTRSQQQALLDNIPFLAWLKDKNGKYISVNTPFAANYNLKPEDIIGKTDFDILPKELANNFHQTDLHVFKKGIRSHYEDLRETKDSKKWIEVYKSPIFNEKGDVIGLTGISREITDRKQLEEAIVKNEEHFRALLQYSSDAITILNKEGIITFESSLKNRILNFSIDELVGRPFKEIIHPEDVHIFEESFKDTLSNPGVQVKKEFRSLHKNKKWIYVESIFSNHLENPAIAGVVVNTRDISDRKMAELKERAYHNNLIFLSNSALELLSLSDREDIYKFIADKLFHFLEHAVIMVSQYNEETDSFVIKQISGLEQFDDKVNTILGRSPEGLIYKRHGDEAKIENAGTISTINNLEDYLTAPVDIYYSLDQILKLMRANKVYNITLARNNKLLGSIGIVTLNKTIIKFKHIIETFAHQVAVALHRSQLEYELVSAKLKAEESDRLKTAFLANMSHEIRTPMNGILGFAEMLNDEKIDESERKKYIDVINSNGKILVNLIDDIIDFAKIEAGQIKILKHEFSLNSLMNQIHSTFMGGNFKKDKANVELRVVNGFVDEASYIKTDPIRLRQILTNLIGNAFKFTNEGHIEFGVSLRSDKMLEFYVQDTGIGIPPEKLSLIFERFVQADNSRSRKYSGSGLGLAISKGFCELLGGEMWAKSEIGRGSTFCFTIPYQHAKFKKQEDAGEKKPKSTYDWSDKLILVAEDDFFSYKFLEGFLKQTKASILHADDGQKAVNICKENKDIDIILMDVQMPEMNGLDATRNIKKFWPELPIVAQTANAIAEEKQKCFEAGFDDFVTKPINISELFMKIEHWMGKSVQNS